jgi:putative ABC transport system ATP-binding protein
MIMQKTIVKVENLDKTYKMGQLSVPALCGVSFDIGEGDFTAIMGPSGCGKSTLMNLIGCLDRPTSGSVSIDGHEISTLSDDELAVIRNKKIGFVFQRFNLLPRMSAIENIELPLLYAHAPEKGRREKALQSLSIVGLRDRAAHKPSELSGGQIQKVAVARALVNDPALILADEPTGNLDSKSGEELMSIFTKLNSMGVTIIMVTHDRDIAQFSRRIIHLKDGQVVQDEPIGKL